MKRDRGSIDLFGRFLDIMRALSEEKADYVLIGGFAVILHGLSRLTVDIDIFIKPEEENLDRVKKALRRVFPEDDAIDSLSLRDLRDYAVVRFGTEDDFYIDLIAGIGEMFRYEDLEWEVRKVEDAQVRIATPETLLRMKRDTVRPEDKRDARFLIELIASKAKDNR